MNTSRDDIHDQLVATYQTMEAVTLNRVLIEQGIDDPDKRREIIIGFLFGQGVILDQCWFKEDGKRWFPGVYFSTVPHDQIDAGTVHLPCSKYGMNFHEYAHGAADWALEHENAQDAIETGNE